MSRAGIRRWPVAAALALLLPALALLLLGGELLTLEQLKAGQQQLQRLVQGHPVTMGAAYLALYALAAALCLPGASLASLAGGALFGLGWGLLLASFAVSVGSLLAFVVARRLLRAPVQARLGARLSAVDHGLQRDGFRYLLTLRLVPLLPYFVINLLLSLTAVRAGRFYLATQLGLLPATLLFVNAGTELAALQQPADVLSPALLVSLSLLGLLPLVPLLPGWLQRWRTRRAARG